MQVRMEKIIEIFLDNKDYKKPNTYYYSQIAAVSAFSISTSKLLSEARSILKHKAQTKKRLATSKTMKYRTWKLARRHLEDYVKMADILKIIQKCR